MNPTVFRRPAPADIRFHEPESRDNTWRPLQWLNFYRLLVAAALSGYLLMTDNQIYIGFRAPELTLVATLGYLLFSAASVFTIAFNRPRFSIQVHSQIVTDIAFMTLVMHTSGGIITGYGMLLNIPIAGGAIIVGGRIAILYASLASISILLQQVYAFLNGDSSGSYPQAGLLGVSYFTTAILAHILATRIRESEALARQRGADLARLATLNEHVIQQLDSGLLVVDARGLIQQANQAAENNLGFSPMRGASLEQVSGFLFHQFQLWRGDEHYQPASITSRDKAELRPHFTRLGMGQESGTLIHLENISATLEQAQRMKLVSLGRLTASIAHEIRNPLGAISHASQLLRESEHLPEADTRLTEIINKHTDRVNTIINNILDISRGGRHAPESFDLSAWIGHLVEEYRQQHQLGDSDIRFEAGAGALPVLADKSQIRQVITNLVDNGLQHTDAAGPGPRVMLRTFASDGGTPVLEVRDLGSGISDEDAVHIFEPFFTTRRTGIGLGLYICKELCEINKASISYSREDDTSRFCIYFSKPDSSRN